MAFFLLRLWVGCVTTNQWRFQDDNVRFGSEADVTTSLAVSPTSTSTQSAGSRASGLARNHDILHFAHVRADLQPTGEVLSVVLVVTPRLPVGDDRRSV